MKKRESAERVKTQECKAGARPPSEGVSCRGSSSEELVRELGTALRTGTSPCPAVPRGPVLGAGLGDRRRLREATSSERHAGSTETTGPRVPLKE